jgi:hypothetical protein
VTQNVIDGRRDRRSWFVRPDSRGECVGLLGGIVVAVVVLALIGWNVVRLTEGKTTVEALACVDPTDQCNSSSYRVANDSNAPVVLRECAHHCGSGDRRLDPILVAPGTMSSSDQVRATVGARDWWEAQTVPGRQIGCLILAGDSSKHDGDAVLVGSPLWFSA